MKFVDDDDDDDDECQNLVSRCKTSDTQWQQYPATHVTRLVWVHRQLLADLTVNLITTTNKHRTLVTLQPSSHHYKPTSTEHSLCRNTHLITTNQQAENTCYAATLISSLQTNKHRTLIMSQHSSHHYKPTSTEHLLRCNPHLITTNQQAQNNCYVATLISSLQTNKHRTLIMSQPSSHHYKPTNTEHLLCCNPHLITTNQPAQNTCYVATPFNILLNSHLTCTNLYFMQYVKMPHRKL